MKNYIKIFCGVFFLASLSYAMDYHVVYSHGFGEDKKHNSLHIFKSLGSSQSVPQYSWSPGCVCGEPFFTRPAVIKLANHLHKKIERDKKEAIVLIGHSLGASVAINCLAKLSHYKDNKKYFENTLITNKTKARNIIAAINEGAVILNAPLLNIYKVPLIDNISMVMQKTVFFGASIAGAICGGVVTSASLTLLANYLLGNYAKNLIARSIVCGTLPVLTFGNYDPYHNQPIESIDSLTDILKCPILLHFCQNDEMIGPMDEDAYKVYKALKGDRTHIFVNDESHNSISQEFLELLNDFKKKYLDGDYRAALSQETQPELAELYAMIYQ